MAALKHVMVLAIGGLILSACYRVPHSGWSCKVYGPNPCSPSEGNWRGLQIGMKYPDALRAVCKMLREGDIRPDDPIRPINAYNPVDVAGSSCKTKPEFEPAAFQDRARTAGTALGWGVHPTDMWCLMYPQAGVENWVVSIEFDEKLRIKSIYGDCPAWISAF